MAKKKPAKHVRKPAPGGAAAAAARTKSADTPEPPFATRPNVLLPPLGPYLQMLVLALVAFLLYANTIPHEYAVDDAIVLKENDYVKQGFGGIPDILGNETFVGFWGKKKDLLVGGRYRPLSLVMFAIEYELFGENPRAHHAVNVLLFVALILVIFNFLRKTALPRWPELAFWAALLFAIHPIHTEVVANIKGRDEILSLLLLLPALGYFLKSARESRERSKYLAYAAGLLFLGLLAKENGLTFLAIAPLSIWVFTRNEGLNSRAAALSGAAMTAGVVVVYLAIRYAVVGGLFGGGGSTDVLNNPYNNDIADIGFSEKYGTIMYVLGRYLSLLFWPHPLSWDYSYQQIPYVSLFHPLALLSLLAYLGMLAAGLYYSKKRNIAGWGIMFYLFSLFISSNILVNIGAFMADRLLFQPSLGFAVILAAMALEGLKRLSDPGARRAIGFGLFGLLVLAGGYKTVTRNAVWKNDETLRIHDVRSAPNSAKTNLGAGEAYFNRALDKSEYSRAEREAFFDSAHKYYERAKEIYPRFNDAYLKSGLTYIWEDKFDKAWQELKIARKLYPNNENLQRYLAVLKGEYFDRSVELRKAYFKAKQAGKLDVAEQRLGQAIHWMEKAVEVDPAYAEAWAELGGLYGEAGQPARSVANFQKAVTHDPDNADFHYGLGLTQFMAGQYDAAIPHLEKALELNPQMGSARQVLQDARGRLEGRAGAR